ncbi:MAG: hypothetical protein IK085_07880 [Clostridia bacterium]|nr:hypothetical protein [Clostridia bacterium]
MKLIIKLLSIVITGALLLSICSCAKSQEAETNTEVPAESTDENIFFSSEADVSQDNEIVSTEAQTGADSTADKDNNTETEKAVVSVDAVELFNNAVKASALKSVTYKRTAGKAVFDPEILNTFFEDDDIKKQTADNLKGVSSLREISRTDVSDSSTVDTDKTYRVTINLKKVALPSVSKPTQNGYIYFMDADEVVESAHIVNPDLEYEKNGNITLSGGKITAEIDKETNTFKSLSISLHESYYDQVSRSIIDNKLANAPSLVKAAVEKYMQKNNIDSIHSTLDYDIVANFGF